MGRYCHTQKKQNKTLVRDREYFIHTKFHQNQSNSFGEVGNEKKSLRLTDDDGRRRTTRYAIVL